MEGDANSIPPCFLNIKMMKKMNDLTELKHIFVSSQTKLFAALAIITFMIAGSLHAQVQNDNLAASIDDLDKLIGCSEE